VEYLQSIEDTPDGLDIIGGDPARVIEQKPAEERRRRALELIGAGHAEDLCQEGGVFVTSECADKTAVDCGSRSNACLISKGLDTEDDVKSVTRLGEPVGSERKREQAASEVLVFPPVDVFGRGASPLVRGDEIHIGAEVAIAAKPLFRPAIAECL